MTVPRRIRVLQVERDEADAKEVLAALRSGGFEPEARRVPSVDGFERMLDAGPWDVILAADGMAGDRGVEVIRALEAKSVDVPVILVGDRLADEEVAAALRAGFRDFVPRHQLTRLSPAVERELEQAALRRERRLAEALMRETQESYRLIVEAVTEGIWLTDADGIVTFVNPAMAAMMGRAADELIGRHELEFFDDAAADIVRAEVARRRRGLSGRYEVRLVRPDGSTLWVHSSATPLKDEAGRYAGSLSVVTDIDARKRREQLAAAEFAVATMLADAPSLTEAAPEILRALADAVETEVALLWTLDRQAGVLRCAEFYTAESVELPGFEEANRELAFAKGIGVPGEAWERGEPAWVTDLSARVGDAKFPRAKLAARYGVHMTFAFPITLRGDVLGVIEVMSREMTEPDDELLQTMRVIGTQIGQFIERKGAEEELRRREAQLVAIFESAPVGMTVADRDRDIAVTNPAFAAMLGYEPDELVGRAIKEIGHPEDERMMLALFKSLVEDGGTRHVERRYIRKDGSTVYASLTASPLYGPDGEVEQILCMAEDITDRKRAELHRAAQHAAVRALAEAPTLGEAVPRLLEAFAATLGWDLAVAWRIDPATGKLSAYKRWLGTRARSVVAFARDVMDAPPCAITVEAFSTGKPVWLAEDLGGDAAAAGLETALAFPISVEGGNPVGVATFYSRRREPRDDELLALVGEVQEQVGLFIERRIAQRRLAESEARFRAVFESTAVGVLLADRDRRIMDANPAFAAMLGYKREELIGRSLTYFTHPDDEGASEESIGILDAKETHTFEKRYLRRDGSVMWARLTASGVREGDGNFRFAIGIIEDVTEKKQLEEQFLQAQKMEAVGRLAGGIAHDFNNLLLAIRGYCELALEQLGEGDAAAQDVKQIRHAADRAAVLTSQLLAFGRKQLLQPRVVDLNEVVGESEGLLRRVVGEDVELAAELADGLKPVRVDPSQMLQALMNLVINARDAMPDGGRVTIRTRAAQLKRRLAVEGAAVEPGSYVVLSVEDTGVGMDAELRRHIFEPFFTTKEAGKGTGLGLSTVYGLVEQSGGAILVDSDPGVGTRMEIYLPEAAGVATGPQDELASAGVAGSETVLLVEDEDPVRTLLTQVLRGRGYRVLSASTADEALTLARGHMGRIDLVATDIVMPGMNGPELVERLQAERPDVRVLLMSGYADLEDVEGEIVDRPFLQKPFPPETFLAKIRSLLDPE